MLKFFTLDWFQSLTFINQHVSKMHRSYYVVPVLDQNCMNLSSCTINENSPVTSKFDSHSHSQEVWTRLYSDKYGCSWPVMVERSWKVCRTANGFSVCMLFFIAFSLHHNRVTSKDTYITQRQKSCITH